MKKLFATAAALTVTIAGAASAADLLLEHRNENSPAGTGRRGGTDDEQVVFFASRLHGLGQRLHGAHEKFIGKTAVGKAR